MYLSSRAAARIAGCAASTIRAAARRGELRTYDLPTVGGGPWYSRREVAKFRPRPVGKPRKNAS